MDQVSLEALMTRCASARIGLVITASLAKRQKNADMNRMIPVIAATGYIPNTIKDPVRRQLTIKPQKKKSELSLSETIFLADSNSVVVSETVFVDISTPVLAGG